MKIIIIGGGAAGLMAAYSSSLKGNETVLLEKNEKLGKKIYITGKGRCNLSNFCDADEFLKNVVTNPKFLYSSINRLDPGATVSLFNDIGLKTKVERGRRVFPESDIASDVTKTLEKALRRQKVDIRLNCCVKEIKTNGSGFEGVVTADNELIRGDACIIATGGLSYPSTGSTGDGYTFAKKMGHIVTDCIPSLVGMKTSETFVKEMEGLSLKNILLKVLVDGKQKMKETGEMLFTHNGVSGPLILTASAKFARDISSGKKVVLMIDLKPGTDTEALDAKMVREFSLMSNKEIKNVMGRFVPASMSPVILNVSGIDPEKKVNAVTGQERRKLISVIKNFELNIKRNGDFSEAVITQGGIKVSEINPKTMESLLVKNVYFAGEVMDVDAFTGGYNLQIAWTTGYTAGLTM